MQDRACHICNYSAMQNGRFLLVTDGNSYILTIVQGIHHEYAPDTQLKLTVFTGKINRQIGQKIY